MKIKKEVYRHWGQSKFIPQNFTPIKNGDWGCKPFGGLWSSPTKDVDYSWEDWCKNNDFRTECLNKHFDFKLKDSARVLFLSDSKDVDKLPRIKKKNKRKLETTWHIDLNPGIDYEKLSEDYDAIMVWIYRNPNLSPEDFGWEGMYYRLYGWDCDSLLVMNPDIIEEV